MSLNLNFMDRPRDYTHPVKGDKNRLTNREVEVLGLITDGLCNKQIADKLFISIKTVEKHRQKVMKKLNLHSVALLTKFALAQGITKNPYLPQHEIREPV